MLCLPRAPAGTRDHRCPRRVGRLVPLPDPCPCQDDDPAISVPRLLLQARIHSSSNHDSTGKQRPWGGPGEVTFRGCCRYCSRAWRLPGSIPEDWVLQIIQVSQWMQHPSTSPSRPLLSSPPGSSQCSREGSHVLNMLLLPHTEIRDPCQRNKWSGFFSSPCFTLLPVEGSH